MCVCVCVVAKEGGQVIVCGKTAECPLSSLMHQTYIFICDERESYVRCVVFRLCVRESGCGVCVSSVLNPYPHASFSIRAHSSATWNNMYAYMCTEYIVRRCIWPRG